MIPGTTHSITDVSYSTNSVHQSLFYQLAYFENNFFFNLPILCLNIPAMNIWLLIVHSLALLQPSGEILSSGMVNSKGIFIFMTLQPNYQTAPSEKL